MIDWMAFVTVVSVSLLSACAAVTIFSLALRLAEGEGKWRKPVSTVMYVLLGCLIAVGLYLIIGDHLWDIFF